jgi:hypothetical protein
MPTGTVGEENELKPDAVVGCEGKWLSAGTSGPIETIMKGV